MREGKKTVRLGRKHTELSLREGARHGWADKASTVRIIKYREAVA